MEPSSNPLNETQDTREGGCLYIYDPILDSVRLITPADLSSYHSENYFFLNETITQNLRDNGDITPTVSDEEFDREYGLIQDDLSQSNLFLFDDFCNEDPWTSG